MLTRRAFAACALLRGRQAFLATGVNTPTPGLKRTLLKQTDGPTEGYVTVEARVEIEPRSGRRAPYPSGNQIRLC